ncbi:MAG: exodeoxyribonuclease III [Ottowia sp.]|nr:exodeoxyribonuclease III [Ottowia sp.]
MIKIITANLNGIRSAERKAFFSWFATQDADFLCVQELKAQLADMTPTLHSPDGYQGHFHYAQKKGYSGTGLYTRHTPKNVQIGFGNDEFDAEGRYVALYFPRLIILSVYLPSGSSSPDRQAAKFRFLDVFMPYLINLRKTAQANGQEIVLCGDINIAHQEIDLKNWKGNIKNSGFLPEERAWLTRLFDEGGYVDVFRYIDPRPEQYTWWSQRGAAYEKNVGWRIDYQIATPGLAHTVQNTLIYKEQKFSDHAPLSMQYAFSLD